MNDYRHAGSHKLTARVLKYAKDRDTSLATLKRANVRSLTPRETFELFKVKREAFLLPTASGEYAFARVFDADTGKWRTPAGEPLRLYEPPPPSGYTCERIRRDPKVPLFLIEGPFKALCASQHGFPSVGFNGCWGWQKHRRPIDELVRNFRIADRIGLPVLDADYDDNRNVGLALLALGDFWVESGGRALLKIMPKVAGRTTGIDDLIARKGAKYVMDLIPNEWESAPVWALREALSPFTDGGNADRLIYRHGEDMRRDPEANRWFVWSGDRWTTQPATTPDVQERMRETVAALFDQASRERDEERRKHLRRWATKSDSAKGVRDAIKLAESNPSIRTSSSDFDRDPMLLGVRNGTVDLRTGKLLPPRREHLITKRAGATFDAGAQAPRWLGFLETICDGDKDRVAFLQRLAGFCLTGRNPERRIFFLYGAGANGKSVYIERLLKILGDYGVPTKSDVIMAMRNPNVDAERPTPFLTALRGSRLVTVSEIDERARINEALIKEMTGDDMMTSRTHRADPVRFRPDFKVLVRGNHKPMVYGDDEAIWDRITLVPFDVRIPEHQQDRTLADSIDATELPGVLNWMLDGCLAWQKRGLAVPRYVTDASTEYREEMDTFSRWLEEQTTTKPTHDKRIAYSIQGTLLQAYQLWCTTNGSMPVGERRFYRKLDERGFQRRKSNGVRCCIGLRLLDTLERSGRELKAREQIESGQGQKGPKGSVIPLNPLERSAEKLTKKSDPSVPSVPACKEARND